MLLRLKGIKKVRAKGRLYFYHRATGKRIDAEPNTPAFVEAVARLDAQAKRAEQKQRQGTLDALMKAYRASPEFAAKAEATRRDYHHVMDWLAGGASMPLSLLDTPTMIAIRDRAAAQHKRRFANYVIQVISLMWNWGKPRGLTPGPNPAAECPKIRRPRSAGDANRAWSAGELSRVMAAMPPELKLPVALAAYAGIREGDMVRLPWSAYHDGVLEWRQRKTGDIVTVPAHRDLRAILDEAPRLSPIMVLGARGRPFTESGFRARFFKVIRALVADGAVQPGLTYHGLRTTAGTNLADAGADTRDIQAVLGHKTAVMAEHYSRGADRKRRAKSAISKLEGTNNGQALENLMENQSVKRQSERPDDNP